MKLIKDPNGVEAKLGEQGNLVINGQLIVKRSDVSILKFLDFSLDMLCSGCSHHPL